uniref:Exonuclease domain-containing protein n=1 Tax=Aegilops tauschii subsp. strangulata TaxID=200361 RepID=A0A453EJU8_AEGTS
GVCEAIRSCSEHAAYMAMAPIMAARTVPYAQGQGHELQQDFDFFLVVDFEATCQKDARIYPQEIIEFPAVLVDAATGRLESAFRRYIRPKHHPVLTQFCRDLTGIRQEDVDGGVDLGQALRLHDAWLEAATTGVGTKRCGGRLAVVTWGDWDCRTMLEFECRFKGIEKPSYFDRWINLRAPFQAALGGGGRVNLQEAVRAAGLDWEGRLHCELDDARNTARLLVELMLRGVKMSITGSLALPRPHISTCGGSSVTCFCYCGQRVATRGGVVSVPGPMQGKCFFACVNGSRVLLVCSN